MQKTAQHRGILNKIREMTNISGQAAEKFFNPEFQKVMESLREKDSTIRSLVAGQEVEGGDPGSDPISLKELYKSAKSNFNRREYMTAIAELGRFHKKLFDLSTLINNLSFDVDQVHHEFLFKDLGDDHKKQLNELKTRFAAQKNMHLVKEAGIMDFLHNLTSKRGRALALWEKRYPNQVKKLKSDTSSLLNKSESILNLILTSLKDMASARATRDVDRYMKGAEKIYKNYQNYDRVFKDFYNENVKGFLDKVELISPVKIVDNKDLAKQEIPVDNTKSESEVVPPTIVDGPPKDMTITPSSSPYAPTALAPEKMPSIPGPPKTPADITKNVPDTIPTQEEGLDNTSDEFESDRIAKEMWGKSSHKKFFNTLEALSNDSPILIKNYIKKYAKSIEETDPTLSIKLFNLTRTIR